MKKPRERNLLITQNYLEVDQLSFPPPSQKSPLIKYHERAKVRVVGRQNRVIRLHDYAQQQHVMRTQRAFSSREWDCEGLSLFSLTLSPYRPPRSIINQLPYRDRHRATKDVTTLLQIYRSLSPHASELFSVQVRAAKVAAHTFETIFTLTACRLSDSERVVRCVADLHGHRRYVLQGEPV